MSSSWAGLFVKSYDTYTFSPSGPQAVFGIEKDIIWLEKRPIEIINWNVLDGEYVGRNKTVLLYFYLEEGSSLHEVRRYTACRSGFVKLFEKFQMGSVVRTGDCFFELSGSTNPEPTPEDYAEDLLHRISQREKFISENDHKLTPWVRRWIDDPTQWQNDDYVKVVKKTAPKPRPVDSSFFEFESVNKVIFKNLQFVDALNLAATCKRLLDFARAEYFPKYLAPNVKYAQIDSEEITFITYPTKNLYTNEPRYKLKKLETSFKFIAEYVEDLTVKSPNHYGRIRGEMHSNFIEHLTNLSSLTFCYNATNNFKTSDLAKIFNDNGHSLKHLDLSELRSLEDKESVRQMIVEKLPNLESLNVQFTFDESYMSFVELSNLTSLNIRFSRGYSFNPILQTLSSNGVIEELKLEFGVFDIEDTNATPLIFKKLKTLQWRQPTTINNFFRVMAKAHMPVITNLNVYCLPYEVVTVMEFIESQITLANFWLIIGKGSKRTKPLHQIAFLNRLIDTLSRSTERPILNLQTAIPKGLSNDAKIVLLKHKHLIYYSPQLLRLLNEATMTTYEYECE